MPYEGERGIGALLEAIAREDDWERVFEGENLIALAKDGASITLEPGGQLELSGAPLLTTFETCAEFNSHLDLVRRVSEPLGLVWLSLGMHPVHDVPAIPRMPKARYDIMRSYLPTRGHLALDMMHLSCTVQANFDFSDEADMVRKMRTATGISPIVSALFANSAIGLGKPSGFVSRRLEIWKHTDPDRCGLLPFVFDEDFGYRRYVEWALDVPMFFLVRDGEYRAAHAHRFRDLLEGRVPGEQASLADWETHLTTLFPDVRLKRFIEVRGADAVPSGLICALPALWKGVLYDRDALEAAWALVSEWTLPERDAATDAVARQGLAATLPGGGALELARELLAIASEGLRRIGHAGSGDPDERRFLEPLREIAELGQSPGEQILARFQGEWQGRISELIEYARY